MTRLPLLAARCTLLICASCSDPKAVQTFAAMAPSPDIAVNLTQSYVAEPAWHHDLYAAWGASTTSPVDRSSEAKTIIQIDTKIRGYMEALGALAADNAIDSATNLNDFKTGLTAFQKAEPNVISTSDVTLISEAIALLTNSIESAYRGKKLSQIIGHAQTPLQTAIRFQIQIVQRGIIPSLNEYSSGYNQSQPALTGNSPWVRYLVNRQLSEDKETATTQLAAANAYIKSLQDIATAHTALYNNRDIILTPEMLDQIKVPAQDAAQAFLDYRATEATATAK